MILLDGCFVLELLLRIHDNKYIDGEDLVYGKPHMFTNVSLDVLLLENQLPLFVLLDIYNLIRSNRPYSPSVHELIKGFFLAVTHMSPPDSNSFDSALHLLDYLRTYYLPKSTTRTSDPENEEMRSFSPSATRLHEAGVKFEKAQSKCLLDLQFDKGVLKIPVLHIQDSTETILRNQIAFEQCHHKVRPILEYTTLIDSIIDTSADVDLLMEKGIITSIVGSSESICELFHNVGKEAVLGDHPLFSQRCKDLNEHCNTRWNKWKATLKREYLHTPWLVISLIVGITLLMLTFIQAVCSVLAL